MKNFKQMQKEGCFRTTSKAIALLMMVSVLLFPSTNYSQKSESNNAEKTDNTNDRLIVKLNELDKLAEFPGGMEKFYEKVVAHLEGTDLSYSGFKQIHTSFVIEKDGTMSDIVVDSNLDVALQKEIIAGIKAIKAKWNPATLDLKPVRTSYTMPIVVNLQ